MNVLDVVIIAAVLAAGVGGWRLGFIARAFAWAGVALGLVIGVHYVPRVVTAFGGTSADDRVTVAVLFLVLVATLGQALGLGIGVIVHRFGGDGRPLPRWDRFAGAAIGTVGVLALVWMIDPVARDGEGLARAHGAGFVGRRRSSTRSRRRSPRSSRPGAAPSRMRRTPRRSARSTTHPIRVDRPRP